MKILNKFRKPSLSVFLASLVLFVSCKENETFKEEIHSEFKSTLIKNLDLSKDLNNVFISKYANKNNNDSNFNFDNIYQVENTETGGISYMIDSYYDEKTKLGAYPKENGDYSFLIVEYVDSGDVKEVIYKKATGELLITILANTLTEEISFVYPNVEDTSRNPDCGDLVTECLDDAYTERGWLSVGLWVVTGFFPEFGIGAAIGCALSECLE